jgi:hypothetical protein
MEDSPLNSALRHFEATEANLVKIEKVWKEIESAIPEDIAFLNEQPEFENNCRSFYVLLEALPKIDGWKPNIEIMDLDAIAEARLEAREIDEIGYRVAIDRQIAEPGKLLREYRYRLNQKRQELIRDSVIKLIDSIDGNLRELTKDLNDEEEFYGTVENPIFEELTSNVDQIDTLLGSSVSRPSRWSDLERHLHFKTYGDLRDIIKNDWPNIKNLLRKSLYGSKEPIPVEIEDLGTLAQGKPKGPVATKLKWNILTDEDFERLVFNLISSETGYENPEWLTNTNAPDRGRDLSVCRLYNDPLGGTIRKRVIIQCKHWLSKSIAPTDIALVREQMKLWEPPRVNICIVATSGRFTTDAVDLIERHNQSDSALSIEMWPESHLERLLASRPALIAEFCLR